MFCWSFAVCLISVQERKLAVDIQKCTICGGCSNCSSVCGVSPTVAVALLTSYLILPSSEISF